MTYVNDSAPVVVSIGHRLLTELRDYDFSEGTRAFLPILGEVEQLEDSNG
ncbi:hypothetical protein [Ruegeria atlantica]|nr:hypothetical protein [Ruegeria atlantica]